MKTNFPKLPKVYKDLTTNEKLKLSLSAEIDFNLNRFTTAIKILLQSGSSEVATEVLRVLERSNYLIDSIYENESENDSSECPEELS